MFLGYEGPLQAHRPPKDHGPPDGPRGYCPPLSPLSEALLAGYAADWLRSRAG